MTDEDKTSYIAILESEIETLKSRLESAIVWKPWWKTFEGNPNRFDFMLCKCKVMTLLYIPHDTAYGPWSAQSVLGYRCATKAKTKEEDMAFVEKYVLENGFGNFTA